MSQPGLLGYVSFDTDCTVVRADHQLAWAFTLKGATKIQIINEAVGLMFKCSPEEIQSGACVAQSGEQL
jgi:hypothetical protein